MYRLKPFFLFIFLLICVSNYACNLSDLTLISITGSGPYTTVVRLCVGYGKTGAVQGADNDTRSISFGFYRVGGITVSSFLPASITSCRGFNNCTMSGANMGPQGPPYNDQATIIFIDPGYYGFAPCTTQPYACITSTVLCGNVGQCCVDYTFVTNNCWDSIKVFGVEGAGNPVAGCYPNADMKVAGCLTALPLFWDNISSEIVNNYKAVKIKWSTFSETNNNYFTIERTKDEEAINLDSLGIVAGTNSMFHTDYSFIDNEPRKGLSLYRVKQTDNDGKTSYTRLIVVYFYPDDPVEVVLYPNPTFDLLNIDAINLKAIQLFNVFGEIVYDEKNINNGHNWIDTSPLKPGIYILKLQHVNKTITSHKVEVYH
ncbi:hypothetical protein BH10BAC1_BH10BAC1_18390 [soil metagenome]